MRPPAMVYWLVFGVGLAFFCVANAGAQTYAFQPLDAPDAVWTGPFGINDVGDITGYFQSGIDKKFRGFVWRRDAPAPARLLEPPGAQITYAIGINNRGDVVGWYTDDAGKWHGYLFSEGKYTTIDHPDPTTTMTLADGINDAGDIVGQYNSTGSPQQPVAAGVRGFKLSKGRFTTIEVPGAVATRSRGINSRGDLVGYFEDAGRRVHGFLWKSDSATPQVIDYPGVFQTEVTGINAEGTLAGRYKRSSDPQRSDWHGFVRSARGEFTPVDAVLPGIGVGNTRVRGINSAGELSGDYYDNTVKNTRGFRARPLARSASRQVILVDDDGADCPGAISTIQEAVTAAAPGATILVCPGTYRGTVSLAGSSKEALKLIAIGREGEVVLQGDHTQEDGFRLEQVSNVVIRGFTVRRFGNRATIATEWGEGNGIHLRNAHYNSVEHNWLVNMDGTGILLVDSSHNTIHGNYALSDDQWLATAGIRLAGAKSEYNSLLRNFLHGNQIAGLIIQSAGPGNYAADNTIINSGGFGIDHRNTSDTWIEGNRVSFGQGYWGTTPAGARAGVGLNLQDSSGVNVFDNRLQSNSGADIFWDSTGDNTFSANACGKSTPSRLCGG